MKIAIIGGGVSGNMAAWLLNKEHDITLFEANDYLGGHTHTHEIQIEDRCLNVDSGFIVFNDWTYPNLIKLLDTLQVDSQPSNMGFSVSCAKTGLEYNGSSLSGLFCQRRNLANPGFLWMLREIVRFNREALELLEEPEGEISLGQYLSKHRYSTRFIRQYLVPMGAAIWSTQPEKMLEFPACFFVRFCHNHGLLSINDRPQWRVVKGGSTSYLRKMSMAYAGRIRLDQPVTRVRRLQHGILVKTSGSEFEHFDAVFFACHSDQALNIIENPTVQEKRSLNAIPYQPNTAVMHTDTTWLPQQRKAWAAWNYHIPESDNPRVSLTYNMNILQSLDIKTQVLVTINPDREIAPHHVIREMRYEHPLFGLESMVAQQAIRELNGENRTWFCGAWCGNGFHEDGVVSAIRAVESFNSSYAKQQQYLRRAG